LLSSFPKLVPLFDDGSVMWELLDPDRWGR
jgi:hypothetical protein